MANVLVALDPMSRTVPATSANMTAIIIAYSATSWPSCCDYNLCIIKCQFPLFLRLVQWLARVVPRVLNTAGRLRLSSFRGRAVRPNVPRLGDLVSLGRFVLRREKALNTFVNASAANPVAGTVMDTAAISNELQCCVPPRVPAAARCGSLFKLSPVSNREW